MFFLKHSKSSEVQETRLFLSYNKIFLHGHIIRFLLGSWEGKRAPTLSVFPFVFFHAGNSPLDIKITEAPVAEADMRTAVSGSQGDMLAGRCVLL